MVYEIDQPERGTGRPLEFADQDADRTTEYDGDQDRNERDLQISPTKARQKKSQRPVSREAISCSIVIHPYYNKFGQGSRAASPVSLPSRA
mgnify:CR=1 FL=1